MCYKCEKDCAKCSSATDCQKCSGNKLLNNGDCLSSCPSNKYATGGVCKYKGFGSSMISTSF